MSTVIDMSDLSLVGTVSGMGAFAAGDLEGEGAAATSRMLSIGGQAVLGAFESLNASRAKSIGSLHTETDVEELPQRPVVSQPPKLSFGDVRQHPSLTTATLNHLDILRAIIATKALNAGVGIRAFVVDVEVDPEEDTKRVVLRTRLDANAAQTLAFWKSLDREVERWADALGPRGRELLASQVGLRFHWSKRS